MIRIIVVLQNNWTYNPNRLKNQLGVIRYLLADFAIVASATTAELVNRLKGIKSVFIFHQS